MRNKIEIQAVRIFRPICKMQQKNVSSFKI